jgi:site-specific recombinase XerD
VRQAGATDYGLRVRALIVVLWRAGLRIGEAMALTEPDLDPGRGSVLSSCSPRAISCGARLTTRR